MSKDNSYMVFVYLALYASLLMFLIFLTDPSANPYDVALVNSLWAYLPLVVIANVFVHKHSKVLDWLDKFPVFVTVVGYMAIYSLTALVIVIFFWNLILAAS